VKIIAEDICRMWISIGSDMGKNGDRRKHVSGVGHFEYDMKSQEK